MLWELPFERLAVSSSPDGQVITCASVDKTVKVWNRVTVTLRGTLEDHTDRVKTVIFLSDSQIIAFALYDDTIKL